jgi:hypothetical protein
LQSGGFAARRESSGDQQQNHNLGSELEHDRSPLSAVMQRADMQVHVYE